MTAWSHVLHHSLSVVTNVEYNACSALPVAISLSWKVNKMLSYRGYALRENIEAQCFQLKFSLAILSYGFLCLLLLFSLISLFGFFLCCNSVLHKAGKWHLQAACCQITAVSIGHLKAEAGAGNSILPLVWFIECQPSAEEWRGEENWFCD